MKIMSDKKNTHPSLQGSVIMRFIFSFYRKLALKYCEKAKKHYMKETLNKFQDDKYRIECAKKAIVYENAILEMNMEATFEKYQRLL